MCYQHEVRKRRIPFQEDKETLEKIEKAAKWLTGDYKVGLLLYGIVGSGKSTLGKAICNLIGILHNSSISSERKGVFRVSALDLAKNVANDPMYFNKLKNQELLFIDDIGTEPASVKSWGNEFSPVVELLYARYDRQLFTIATSNLKDSDFGERYGIRIADRMEEMFERIYYQNKSYRKWNELKDKAHSNAVKHGFWEGRPSDKHFLCLVISELMEAVNAHRRNKFARVPANRKETIFDDRTFHHENKYFRENFEEYVKDTVEDELADAAIRLLDLAGANNLNLNRFCLQHVVTPKKSFTENIYAIVKDLVNYKYSQEEQINYALHQIRRLSEILKINLLWHIEQKMYYNEGREDKHGKEY